MNWLKPFVFHLVFVLLAGPVTAAAQTPVCRHPFVFFDLGMTIVDTKTHDYNPMLLMPGAGFYMETLHRAGFTMGAISDVPLTWGRDFPDVALIRAFDSAKWLRMIYYMQGHYPADKTSWQGPPLDVALFGQFHGQGADTMFDGRVILPLNEHEPKSTGSLEMFWKARTIAARSGCRALFMGEDLKEVTLARRAGLAAYWVGHDGGPLPQNFYLPVGMIDRWGL